LVKGEIFAFVHDLVKVLWYAYGIVYYKFSEISRGFVKKGGEKAW